MTRQNTRRGAREQRQNRRSAAGAPAVPFRAPMIGSMGVVRCACYGASLTGTYGAGAEGQPKPGVRRRSRRLLADASFCAALGGRQAPRP
jgi:hypothetical protein